MSARTRRRPLALVAALATVTAAGATALALGASTASAVEMPLSGYELTWGIKQSYRSYIANPYVQGTFTPADGATQAEDNGAFTFVNGTGTYDSSTHAMDLAFEGGLTIASRAHGFALTLSDIRFHSGTKEITADVTKDGTTEQDVPLATVDEVTREMTDMATTLTPEAAEVFGNAGYAGAAGDPLTVRKAATASPSPSATEPTAEPGDTASPEPTDTASTPAATPTATPSASAPASQEPTGAPTAQPTGGSTEAPARGEIVDGTLGWGVKESFRTYVANGPAKGAITTAGGATQAAGNGVFTFVGATGTYDTDKDTLAASFKGSVTFKGHETNGAYAMDLTFANLRTTLKNGKGELVADVTEGGSTSADVVLAELKAPKGDLTVKNGVISVNGVQAVLTAEGAEAFIGFYEAGSALDPLTLAVAVTEGAALPGTDDSGDGGSGGDAAGGPSGSTGDGGVTGGVTGDLGGGLASTGSDVPVGALSAAAAAAIAAGAGVVLAVRRRRPAEEA
jgi:hypothetical protein